MVSESKKATKAAVEVLNLESTPFLTLEIQDGNNIQAGTNGQLPGEIWCVVQNAGRGPAIVTGILRYWQPAGQELPTPVKGLRQTPDGKGKFTQLNIPIGPSTKSVPIRARAGVSSEPYSARHDRIYFLGYVEFANLDRSKKYVSGFAYVIYPGRPKMGLHLAPDHEGLGRYWYHEEIQ